MGDFLPRAPQRPSVATGPAPPTAALRGKEERCGCGRPGPDSSSLLFLPRAKQVPKVLAVAKVPKAPVANPVPPAQLALPVPP